MADVRPSSKRDSFNELSRVQIPALMHLSRLGYTYIGKLRDDGKGEIFDGESNILLEVFKRQFRKLNPNYEGQVDEILRSIKQELDNDDLGKSFYKRLISVSPTKLIDFVNVENNTFHYTAEFSYRNGQDEFRPDITLFVNGLPLVFVEVKQPNNRGGMLAESDRMIKQRFPNKKFRRFINITQLMIFSNNMEYDAAGGITPIQGAFYCTGARATTKFNCFREDGESQGEVAHFIQNYPYLDLDPSLERKILNDFNCQVNYYSNEYKTNLQVTSPTNRILTSMCSKQRLLFLLQYGIAFVNMEREVDGKIESLEQKHIMRYQQFFAAQAVVQKLQEGVKSGVIWHTQGSGKTALSYHLVRVLNDFYAQRNTVAKFYFIVDRLDLLEQAASEFEARGLEVKTAVSRQELMTQFRTNQSQDGASGKTEVTVVNIQKFDADEGKEEFNEYATNLQRIFIIDEAHRSYNPKGNFLANLLAADHNAVKIALTGTPLLTEERETWKVFGDYIHKYYYDKSIQDGYTLKIIREDIETSYRESLSELHDDLSQLIAKRHLTKEAIIEHDRYVDELLRYIITDLQAFRLRKDDTSLGGMVICETSEQARKLFTHFEKVQDELADEKRLSGQESNLPRLRAGLILHDSDDKETRKEIINAYKKDMGIDILIVFNMLLTGFDAPRLKRLYFGRKLQAHNLLQALTRVNRPYKDNHYGYVVDFADIKENFEQTSLDYYHELNRFNDPNETGKENTMNTFEQVLVTPEEIESKLQQISKIALAYPLDNVEEFSSVLSQFDVGEMRELQEVIKSLENAKDVGNLIATYGDVEQQERLSKIELTKLPALYSVACQRREILRQKEMIYYYDTTKAMVNLAMEYIEFSFKAISKEELKIISNGDDLKQALEKVKREMNKNMDQADPKFISIKEAFLLRLKQCGVDINSTAEYHEHLTELNNIYSQIAEQNRLDSEILKRYNDDEKFLRIHKRIREMKDRNSSAFRTISNEKLLDFSAISNEELIEYLRVLKDSIDMEIYNRKGIVSKDSYFNREIMQKLIIVFKDLRLDTRYKFSREEKEKIRDTIFAEYTNQYKQSLVNDSQISEINHYLY